MNQIRDILFTKVGQHAVRSLNNRTFEHLHRLSLRFHLERRTGGLSRVIERGTRGVDLILRMGILQLAPTALELLLVCALLTYLFQFRLRDHSARDHPRLHVVHVRRLREAHRDPARDER